MAETRETRCCIAGGGPAGMMLGVLLARAGIDTIVLEKHEDFLRDFRGDTVHPSTLEVMHELGWLEGFLARPHQKVYRAQGMIGDERVTVADFSELPVHCPFIALVPQWDFLDFVADRGREHPTFHLEMCAEATDLVRDGERVVGLRARTEAGELEVRADLVVAADGRHSTLRRAAGLEVQELGAPIDVLWMRLPREEGDPDQVLGHVRAGHVLVMLDRGDYWQCAFVIPKGGFDALREEGLDAFRATLASIVPFLEGRLDAIRSFDDASLLTVRVDRLREWALDGLLCIGDAAHAMSPIGGVGINLAVQDAVAAANLLREPLARGRPTLAELRAVQRRRSFPTRATQRLQVLAQDRVLAPALRSGPPTRLPLLIRLLQSHPTLRRIPARMIGLGFRPEHVG